MSRTGAHSTLFETCRSTSSSGFRGGGNTGQLQRFPALLGQSTNGRAASHAGSTERLLHRLVGWVARSFNYARSFDCMQEQGVQMSDETTTLYGGNNNINAALEET